MDPEVNVLKVNIYGTEYPIKGNTDVEYIRKVAEYVDAKMREVDESVSVKSALKVAILAALNIADELFRERSEKEHLVAGIEQMSGRLLDALNDGPKDV